MDAIEQFLLNPNVVYLILVFGFLLTIMALISPGTTILEIGAFFTLEEEDGSNDQGSDGES